MLFEFATYVRFSRLSRLFYSLMPRERPYYYLGGVAVEPEHRNQRLGTRLIQWGLDCAEAEDCTVFVNCWDALLPYYKRLGFLPVCEGRLAEIDATCHGLLWMPGNHRSQDTADEQ
jgi:predicted N-acetyltransferase YhbS